MTTNAQSSLGVKLQRGDAASPEVFSDLVELTSISGPSGSSNVIPIETLDTDYVDKLIGTIDEGQVSFEGMLLLDTTQDALIVDRDARTLRNFRIELDSTSPAQYLAFSAYVIQFSPNFSTNQPRTVSGVLEISGQVTWPS